MALPVLMCLGMSAGCRSDMHVQPKLNPLARYFFPEAAARPGDSGHRGARPYAHSMNCFTPAG